MLELRGPTLSAPAAAPASCEGAEVLQVAFELPLGGRDRATLLPAGLAPTIPTVLTVLVVRVAAGPLGPFSFAQVRLSCRSGVRPRAVAAASVVDADDDVAAALAAGWGIGAERGAVVVDRRYDRVRAAVPTWGADVELVDPGPISGADIQYVVGLHPVTTPDGTARLAQVELDVVPDRAERGRPVLLAYQGLPLAGGDGVVQPVHPVAATIAVGTLTLPRLRFLLDGALPPHLGTSVLAAAATS